MYMERRVVSALMVPVISVGLWSCGTQERKNSEYYFYDMEDTADLSDYVKTAEKVNVNMLNADYWIKKQERPYDTVMTKDEILNWNNSYKAMSNGNKYNFYGYDEDTEEDFIEGEILREIIEKSFEVPSINLYDKSGNKLTKEFWKDILDNRNLFGISDVENLAFGYTVSRCDMRMVPYRELVTAEKDNDFFCEFQVSSILINEPVIVVHKSKDGRWYYVFSEFCNGWVESKNVGLCEDKNYWQELLEPEDFLMITGDKVWLEEEDNVKKVTDKELHMGTKLKLVRYENYIGDKGRVPYECFIVKIPIRCENGKLDFAYGFIPVSRDVKIGYLEYTKANLIEQMFKINGDRYGWGGMYNARDCSQYIMEVYKTFGFKFGRNSATQSKMPFGTYDVENESEEEKLRLLEHIPVGSILYFPGHVMMYLGKAEGEHYVISATGRMRPEDKEKENVIYAHTTLVTPLSVRRISGMTWLEALTKIKIIDV